MVTPQLANCEIPQVAVTVTLSIVLGSLGIVFIASGSQMGMPVGAGALAPVPQASVGLGGTIVPTVIVVSTAPQMSLG